LTVTPEISELRRVMRQSTLPFMRDRIEEADQEFFRRVELGFAAIAAAEPDRFRVVDASGTIESVGDRVWDLVRPALPKIGRW
jgi:dTMP kinase